MQIKRLTRDDYWKIFLLFLKHNKIFSLYYKNYNNFSRLNPLNGFIKIKAEYTYWIMSAFSWSNTKEGLKFWSDKHRDWLIYIKKYEKEYYCSNL